MDETLIINISMSFTVTFITKITGKSHRIWLPVILGTVYVCD